MVKIILTVQCIFLAFSLAIPNPDDKKDHIIKKDLSDEKHYQGAEHNSNYDHEAFLGEEAKTFDQLSPEESKRRLSLIVDKIDKDSDGFVTQDELKGWIQYTQKKYIKEDVDNQWKTHVPVSDNKLNWETYKKSVYGFMEDMDQNELEREEHGASYIQMLKRDRRRWNMADEDQDEALTREEFTGFLHPEEVDKMREIIVVETMEDIDKDKDGKVSLQEYIGDLHRGGEGDEEPDWVSAEREQFSLYRDKDGDGFMDTDEVRNWIIPGEFDHAEAEARHLIFESDIDADQKLTKNEVLNKYDLFVGSQATDFGEALSRHDEF